MSVRSKWGPIQYDVVFVGGFYSYTIILQKHDVADKDIGCDLNQALSIIAKVGIKEFNAAVIPVSTHSGEGRNL